MRLRLVFIFIVEEVIVVIEFEEEVLGCKILVVEIFDLGVFN